MGPVCVTGPLVHCDCQQGGGEVASRSAAAVDDGRQPVARTKAGAPAEARAPVPWSRACSRSYSVKSSSISLEQVVGSLVSQTLTITVPDARIVNRCEPSFRVAVAFVPSR